MLFQKRTTCLLVLLGLFQLSTAQTPTAEELVGIHVLTDTQINAIANPIIGSLVFNSDSNSLEQYDGADWTVPGSSIVTNLIQATTTGIITYTNEDSTPQTANVISTDANNTLEVGSDGGALLTTQSIDVYDANTSYVINTNTYRKIQLNTSRLNQGGVFTFANNEITVTEAGTYEIEYGVAVQTNAQARMEAKLQINGIDLVASQTYDGGWYKKVTATRKIYVSLNANDVISIWAQRTQQFNGGANSVTTIKDGSYLLAKKLD